MYVVVVLVRTLHTSCVHACVGGTSTTFMHHTRKFLGEGDACDGPFLLQVDWPRLFCPEKHDPVCGCFVVALVELMHSV